MGLKLFLYTYSIRHPLSTDTILAKKISNNTEINCYKYKFLRLLFYIIKFECESKTKNKVNMVRRAFEDVLHLTKLNKSPLIWRLFLNFEIKINFIKNKKLCSCNKTVNKEITNSIYSNDLQVFL